MTPDEAFEKALLDLIDESPALAMKLLAGSLVTLVLNIMEGQGLDITNPITLEGGPCRDITIEPPKYLAPDASARGVH